MPLGRLLLVGALLVVAGCGQADGDGPVADPSPGGSTTPTTGPEVSDTAEEVPGVTLEVSGAVAPEPAFGSGQPPVTRVSGAQRGLLVRYTVRNRRDAPVAVVDRLPRQGAAMSITDEPDALTSVLREGPDGQLDIVRRAAAGQGLDYTPTTQASVVAASASHTGRVFVPFPVTDYSPPNPFPDDATTWRLCLGVVASPDGLTRSTDGGVVLVPGTGYDGESLVCSEEQPLPDGWR